MAAECTPPEDTLRRAATVRRLLDLGNTSVINTLHDAGLVKWPRRTLMRRLAGAFRDNPDPTVAAILRVVPVPGLKAPNPLTQTEFARFAAIAEEALAASDDPVPMPEEALTAPTVALQLVLLAQVAAANHEMVRIHLNESTVVLCGLWAALRETGEAYEFPAIYDSAARALAVLVLGSPYEAPLALSVLKVDFRPDLGPLEAEAVPLTATLPEPLLSKLAHCVKMADAPPFVTNDENADDPTLQVHRAQQKAVRDALSPVLRDALVAEDRRRLAQREAAKKESMAVAMRLQAEMLGFNNVESMRNAFADIQRIIDEQDEEWRPPAP